MESLAETQRVTGHTTEEKLKADAPYITVHTQSPNTYVVRNKHK